MIPAAFMILMMTIIIFSQLAMEIYAYNFAANKNIQKNTLISVGKKIQYTRDLAEEEVRNNKVYLNAEQAQIAAVVSPKKLFVIPVKGGVTTSMFGDRVSRRSMHLGHDWAVNIGTKVTASADGIVEKAYYSQSYGYNVLVSHGNGIETRYAHLSKLSVTTGQYVRQNQVLGLSGSTGESTGPHLHFEVIKEGKKVNPLNYVN